MRSIEIIPIEAYYQGFKACDNIKTSKNVLHVSLADELIDHYFSW